MSEEAATILIVEDDLALRRMMAEQLKKNGYRTVDVPDAESCLAFLQKERVDLICLDLALPEQSGFSVCETIRKNEDTKEIPILVVTARVGLEDYARALEVGADRFLRKPFKNKDLLEHIQQLLRA